MKENEEQLKKKAADLFYQTHGRTTPAEAGFNGIKVWSYRDWFKKNRVIVFAKDDDAVDAYIKHQNCVRTLAFKWFFVVAFAVVVGMIAGLYQVAKGAVPTIWLVLVAVLLIVVAIYVVMYFKCKPLEKKFCDEDGRLKIVTFMVDKNDKIKMVMYDPNKVYVDDD